MKVVPRQGARPVYVLRWRAGRRWRQQVARDSAGEPIPATAAKRRLAERAAEQLERELAGRADSIGWLDFCRKYAAEHLAGLSAKSRKLWVTARSQLEDIVDPATLADIDADALAQFVLALRGRELSEATVATYLRTIRAALGWAKAPAGLIDRVPDVALPRTRATKHMRGRPLTGEEVDRMAAACRKARPADYRRWRRLIRGLDAGGLRLGEALALSWNRSAPVAVLMDGGRPAFRFYAEGQKGRRDELLPVTPDFAAMLEKTPANRRRGPVFRIRLSVSRVSRILSKIGRLARVRVGDSGRHATAHDLRRTFGSRWAPRVEPLELMKLMRHKSLETTMRYYVRLNADALAEKLWRAGHGTKENTDATA